MRSFICFIMLVGFLPHISSDVRVFLSSQVLFSTTQKLIQHQIINYTDILKWLREVLVCRNTFLLKHRDHANIGSHQAICKHAHIKLEVRC